MEENKRKPPVETKHLRRLIRYRIQKKFNMYDRLYGRPESIYRDRKDPGMKIEEKNQQLICMSSNACDRINDLPVVSTIGEFPQKRVTSPVRTFTDAKTGTPEVLSSNESHIQATEDSFSYNQSHFYGESSMSDCNVVSCDSQTRPLSISPLHCKGLKATNPESTDAKASFAGNKLDFSHIKDNASRHNMNNKIINCIYESLQQHTQLNDVDDASYSVKFFLETHCSHCNDDMSASLSILIERLKALALYFSKNSSCQYIAWRICSALKDILCVEAEADTNHWNHSSLNFLRMYLQVDRRNGFILSPWPEDEEIGAEDSGMVSNEENYSTELSSVST